MEQPVVFGRPAREGGHQILNPLLADAHGRESDRRAHHRVQRSDGLPSECGLDNDRPADAQRQLQRDAEGERAVDDQWGKKGIDARDGCAQGVASGGHLSECELAGSIGVLRANRRTERVFELDERMFERLPLRVDNAPLNAGELELRRCRNGRQRKRSDDQRKLDVANRGLATAEYPRRRRAAI